MCVNFKYIRGTVSRLLEFNILLYRCGRGGGGLLRNKNINCNIASYN